jgi:hypothetical protein
VFPRFARLFVLVVVLAAVVGGCGGGGGSTGASSGSTTTKQLSESPGNVLQRHPPKQEAKSPLDPLAAQLEKDGFGELQTQPGGGNHVASDFSGVAPGGEVLFDVYYYDDPSFGRKEAARVEEYLRARSGNGLVSSHGHYLITMSGQSKLTAGDKKNFKIIVKAAKDAESKE